MGRPRGRSEDRDQLTHDLGEVRVHYRRVRHLGVREDFNEARGEVALLVVEDLLGERLAILGGE